ncbi:MAG: hypothetical protein WC373_08000 [Smithella sp.]|jgi:energy-converting hydrogenase Eha subunit C
MGTYPVVHIIALIIGGIVLFLLKRKYQKMKYYELLIIFILFVILIAIFTDTGIDLAKNFIDIIQVE